MSYLRKLRLVIRRLLDLVARVAAKMGGSFGPSQDIATLRQASAHAPAGPIATSNRPPAAGLPRADRADPVEEEHPV